MPLPVGTKSIIIDPEGTLPDVNRPYNATYKPLKFTWIFDEPQHYKREIFWMPWLFSWNQFNGWTPGLNFYHGYVPGYDFVIGFRPMWDFKNNQHIGSAKYMRDFNNFGRFYVSTFNFELSQNYFMFCDKLEKANYFLENIISTLNEPYDSRLMMWLVSEPIQDGGQWDMFVNLMEKYVIMPQSVMPESFQSSHSYMMNRFITRKLRENAAILRNNHSKGTTISKLRKQKEEKLAASDISIEDLLKINKKDSEIIKIDENQSLEQSILKKIKKN